MGGNAMYYTNGVADLSNHAVSITDHFGPICDTIISTIATKEIEKNLNA